ncbi:hypothetical protein Bphy_3916 [Paraburkholderia phymatum STM815]|uniref:Uncharacterized protein n=1 Tax=Paraburkholderia phymatum (strain DSM 17167 / CIP 108236 / LMG 21445 / STM815) TaxID=391038 RepID=B2JNU2_PARP8|nr:hypothetical protein Bphy_3916 [Paraburkholderia phymatum STM815]
MTLPMRRAFRRSGDDGRLEIRVGVGRLAVRGIVLARAIGTSILAVRIRAASGQRRFRPTGFVHRIRRFFRHACHVALLAFALVIRDAATRIPHGRGVGSKRGMQRADSPRTSLPRRRR